MIFINYTNHPSAKWSAEQRAAAEVYGEIQDLQFPEVSPDMDMQEVAGLAEAETKKILAMKPKVVLCQGEFTLCFAVIERLLAAGIEVVAACSRRAVQELTDKDGTTRKQAEFRFVQFREYK